MAKYAAGSRVRIKGMPRERDPYSGIWQYENLPGIVVDSASVATEDSDACDVTSTGPAQVLKDGYKVALDIGVELNYVAEDCLESLGG